MAVCRLMREPKALRVFVLFCERGFDTLRAMCFVLPWNAQPSQAQGLEDRLARWR